MLQEDACSICYGDMQERGSRVAPELVWCQEGCGHNVHARCLNVWGKHQVKQQVFLYLLVFLLVPLVVCVKFLFA